MRLCAIAAMLATGGDAVKAHPVFLEYCPDHGLQEEINAFLRRWYQRYCDREEGECFLEDKRPSGRPAFLKPEDIDTAVQQFPKGYYSHGRWHPYSSVEEVGSRLGKGCRNPATRLPRPLRPVPATPPNIACLPPPVCRHVRGIPS